MKTFANAVHRGVWKEWNIRTWNELLLLTFDEVNQQSATEYASIKGLEQAKEFLDTFREREGRLPITSDEEVKGIAAAAFRGAWKPWGIRSWNDLLLATFGEINNEPKYASKEGLETAQSTIRDFWEQNGRSPTIRDEGMAALNLAAQRGVWKPWNITSWNDLLYATLGKVNYKKYATEEALNDIQDVLREFQKKNGRLPRYDDEGMSAITSAAERGVWKPWNITSWNDLIYTTFGKTNKEKYPGKKGLQLAQEILRTFREREGRKPTGKDKGIRGIYKAVNRGIWESLGIENWNDLLIHTFGDVNERKSKYASAEALKVVQEKLRRFEKTEGRLPTARDKGMKSFMGMARRGIWEPWNISSWNDLILKTFGKVNNPPKYVGTEGLRKVQAFLRVFQEETGSLPTIRDKGMRVLAQAAKKGHWEKEGIHTWNDLLQKTFGTTNRKIEPN